MWAQSRGHARERAAWRGNAIRPHGKSAERRKGCGQLSPRCLQSAIWPCLAAA